MSSDAAQGGRQHTAPGCVDEAPMLHSVSSSLILTCQLKASKYHVTEQALLDIKHSHYVSSSFCLCTGSSPPSIFGSKMGGARDRFTDRRKEGPDWQTRECDGAVG
jgi:hypothetical protein